MQQNFYVFGSRTVLILFLLISVLKPNCYINFLLWKTCTFHIDYGTFIFLFTQKNSEYIFSGILTSEYSGLIDVIFPYRVNAEYNLYIRHVC